MRRTIKVGPLTRVEGHLDIEVTVDTVSGVDQVVAAKSSGTMFRGFELILTGRDPLDAPRFTQRICGVCPVSHGMASSKNLESAFGLTPPANGRIMRNLVLGANFLQSHVLHFYHLAALDYVDTTGLLNMSPWTPRFVTDDMAAASDIAGRLVEHYVQAIEIRRKAHQMGAIFGGRQPIAPSFVPGGCSETVAQEKIDRFRSLLDEIRSFIDGTLLPDVQAVADRYPAYLGIGKGCGNLLAYGVFDLDPTGTTKLLARGRYTDHAYSTVEPQKVTEYVRYSNYTAASGNRNPSVGVTVPQDPKSGAYSWIKAPRYLGKVHEVGPLARMWVNGDYRDGTSVVDRLLARALEARKIAYAMGNWLNQLVVGAPAYTRPSIPSTATGIGLTEAPRGALGHWINIASGKIQRYQVVTPTAWNASPKDDFGQGGAIEQALVGTPVKDANQPIEVLRVVHSFDPCLACAVHLARPGKPASTFVVGA